MVKSIVGDPLYFWLMDPDPTPDPTFFFSDFKDAKFFFSSYLYAKIFVVNILFCKRYFSMLNTFMSKGKDPEPYLWPTLVIRVWLDFHSIWHTRQLYFNITNEKKYII